MKRFAFCMVVLAAMALVGAAWAGEEKEKPQVRLELDLADGSHVIGVPGIEAIPVQTSYAKMDVALTQILTVKIEEDHEKASIDLRNGDKIKGVVSLPPIQLETLFGSVKIGVEQIRKLDVVLSRAVLSGSWITPIGGNVTMKDGEVTLSGTGDGADQNAIAILDEAIPDTCRITGELKRTGPQSGFVVGYNSKAKTFAGVFANADTGKSGWYSHNGTSRTGINLFPLAFPPVDTYAKFTIDLSPKKVTFQIENSTFTMDIPAGVDGNRFGIQVYNASTMQVRNLVISDR